MLVGNTSKNKNLGGAIFGVCRDGKTFINHNRAMSYYAVRGIRGVFCNINITLKNKNQENKCFF
ncbi:MAG: DUF4256 domain-containing protein [Chitinophagales bacterium]|nr:DUF4256 domain-containing protein [Chitinophagales bacterium]MBP6153935.1 DUF4256 domain-containing protein [Chitinophagales bacterium]